jgi:hypothetical protein
METQYKKDDIFTAMRIITTSIAETERMPLKMKLSMIKKITKLCVEILIYRGDEVSQELKDQAKDEDESDSNIEESTEALNPA